MLRLEADRVAEAIEKADGMCRFSATKKLRAEYGQDADQVSPRNIKNRRLGVLGETALRWCLGMPRLRPPYDYQELFDARQDGDVGSTIEVRGTDAFPNGKLLLHEKGEGREHGDDELPWLGRDYVLVVFDRDWNFKLPGFLAMVTCRKVWWDFDPHGNRPCKAVGQDQLWPIMHLVATENGREYRMRKEILGSFALRQTSFAEIGARLGAR